MSFWSWIGLADKKQLLSLNEDVQILKNDNLALQEQNSKLIELLAANMTDLHRLIENKSDEGKQNIDRHFEAMQAGIESILENIQSLKKRLEEINGNVTQKSTELSTEIASVKETEDRIKHTAIEELDELKKQIADIEKTLSKDEIKEKLTTISESVQELWRIIKAIWVDSVLDDIEART